MLARGCGLMWEEWRRTRTVTVTILLLLSSMSVLVWSLEVRKNGRLAAVCSGLIVFGLLIHLLLSQSTRSSVDASIPNRRFRLPMSSFELTFWPFIYRLAVITLATGFVSIISRLVTPDFPVFAPLCFFWLILSALHTLFYTSPLLGRWLTGFSLFLLWLGTVFLKSGYRGPGSHYPRTDFVCMGAAVAAALVVTTAAIRKMRTGGWDFAGVRRALSSRQSQAALADVVIAQPPFRSAARAQRWFEWRSISKSLTIVLAFMTLAFIVTIGASVAFDFDTHYTIDPSLIFTMLLCNSAAAGLWAFANQSARARRNSSMFVQTRPVSDFRLARGKLESAVVIILVNLVVVALMVLAMTLAVGLVRYNQEWTKVFDVEWQLRYMLLLSAGILLSWIVYWRGAFVAAVFIPVSVFANNAPRYFERWVYTDGLLKPAATALILLSMVVLAIPFLRAYRERLLSHHGLLALAVAWAAMTAIASTLFLYVFPGFNTAGACAINALLALLALTPFAKVPLKISHARHQ